MGTDAVRARECLRVRPPRERKVIMKYADKTLGMWAILTLCSAALWGQDIKPLVERLPNDVNVLVLIDGQKVRASAMGEKEGWNRAAQERLGRRATVVLPETRQLVVGASLDLNSLRVLTETSVMSFVRPPTIDAVAQASAGRSDSFSGHPAVWTPADTYFVQFDATVFGAVYPANRQFAARWVTPTARLLNGPVSDYLRAAVAADIEHPAHILLAVDLKDAISAAKLRESYEIQPPP